MTIAEKEGWIDQFEQGSAAFDDVLLMSPELQRFRPSVDAWTIHEHLVHFVDSEIATFHRYRKAIAEPQGQVVGYDESVWTASLRYHSVDLHDMVSLLKLLRKVASSHLKSIVTQDWSAFSYEHDSQGLVTLESWIKEYVDHVRFHREYINRNIALFAKNGR